MATKTREFYTQGGWEGNKYDSSIGGKEAAKLIREWFKEIGWTPKNGYKFSVRYESYAGGCSVNVYIKELPFNPINPKKIAFEEEHGNSWVSQYRIPNTYTDEYKELEDKIRSFGNQYRFDDSDGMIDYFHTNFYYFVKLEGFSEELWRLEYSSKQKIKDKIEFYEQLATTNNAKWRADWLKDAQTIKDKFREQLEAEQ
jgi:hypothetical protein